jgi:aspartyl-tRNA(Asn)/glutamyl-tRNA(Gln) amidotransferase subunit A
MPWITKSPELYQEATRTLIQRAADNKSAAYAEARHQVDVVRRDVKKVFANVDLLITPTQRGTAPLIVQPQRAANAGRGTGGGAAAGGGGIVNTAAFDIYGLPTITVPCGFSVCGPPIGVQISGAHFAESTVLRSRMLMNRQPGGTRNALNCAPEVAKSGELPEMSR